MQTPFEELLISTLAGAWGEEYGVCVSNQRPLDVPAAILLIFENGFHLTLQVVLVSFVFFSN